MRHKILYLFNILLAVCLQVRAYDFKQNGICYNIISAQDKTVEVASSDPRYSGDITIDSEVTFEDITFTVTGVGKGAFHNCPGLISVKLPNTIETIGESAFSVSHDLQSVEIPPSVTQIGQFAFHYCDNLKSATIPDGVTQLPPCTFAYCTSLEKIEMPKGISEIGLECFQYCESLSSVSLPDSLEFIQDYAFEFCKNLKTLSIPSKVSLIGELAFIGCENVKSLEINSSTTIRKEAFRNCNAIETIKVNQETPIYCPDSAFPGIVKMKATLYVPAGAKAAYQASDSWGQFVNIVEMESSGIRAIRSDAADGKAYNINGTPATDTGKGIIIQNGKKAVRK